MLWGSFGNSASAMNAMSTDLGTISQNIANINTYGYKRADTLFHTQLSEHLTDPTSKGNAVYLAGDSQAGTDVFGVGTTTRNLISTQGGIQTTGNASDIAINGNGFFIVSPPSSGSAPTTTSLTNPQAAYYTRDGSFQQMAGPQGQAYYVNGAGDYLMGWMADPTTGVVDQSTLTPVYTLPNTTMAAMPTTNVALAGNIPSDLAATQTQQGSAATVADDQGRQQRLSLSWTRVDATTWTVTATGVSGGTVGSTAPGATDSYTVSTDNMGNVVSVTPTGGGTAVSPPATVPFAVTWADGNAGASDVDLGTQAPTLSLTNTVVPVYDNASNTHNVTLNFEKTGPDSWYLHFDSPDLQAAQTSTATVADAAGAQVQMGLTWTSVGANTWKVTPSTVSGGDIGTGSVTVQVAPGGGITAVNGQAVPPASTAGSFFSVATPGTGSVSPTVDLATALPSFPTITSPPVALTFDGNGNLVSPKTVTFAATWADGQTTNATIDLSKLSQYSSGGSGLVQVDSLTQDGFPSGSLKSATFQADGTLLGAFSNGHSRPLFQVPLATFQAPDSLTPVSGNMFQLSSGSGAANVQAIPDIGAGNGTAGSTTLVAGAVEGSNVDLQGQMSDMITAQKAYSMNAKVFQTADEMTTAVRDLVT